MNVSGTVSDTLTCDGVALPRGERHDTVIPNETVEGVAACPSGEHPGNSTLETTPSRPQGLTHLFGTAGRELTPRTHVNQAVRDSSAGVPLPLEPALFPGNSWDLAVDPDSAVSPADLRRSEALP